MSLYIDLKYINLIGSRLELFKNKGSNLFNFRCPLCGDSQTKRNKARGYFYRVPNKNVMSMKCHNCSASMYFGSFLQQFDSNTYKNYVFEKFREDHPVQKKFSEIDITKLDFKVDASKISTDRSLIDDLMPRLSSLPDDNEAVAFAIKRQIPRDQFDRLYYIDNISKIKTLINRTFELGKEPRLVLPFFDEKYKLVGVTCRALRGEKLRYVTLKVNEDAQLIFGLERLNKDKKVYAVEGPIDSLFLPNAIAVGGTSFGKIGTLGISQEKLVIVLDNQPRNKEVCAIYNRYIKSGYNVCIWSQTQKEKDINDLVITHSDPNKVKKIIDRNTYQGLEAELQFVSWKRC